MTDRINALACLAETPGPSRDAALAEYYASNKDKPLNMLKWLAVQVGRPGGAGVEATRGGGRGERGREARGWKRRGLLQPSCWEPGAARFWRHAPLPPPAPSPRRDRPLPAPPPRRPQAGSGAPGNLAAVQQLLEHPAFAITNPNSCYSLFLGFARSAPNFHAKDGSGYQFLADAVLKVGWGPMGGGAGLLGVVWCAALVPRLGGWGCRQSPRAFGLGP
jgi:hypothetical protein